MKEGYRLLGDFICQVDVRNTDGKEENLLGVSVQKMFIPSIANTVGTDFTKYKVVKRGQFTYIPDTSRRGDKIGIALLTDYDEGLVSNCSPIFSLLTTFLSCNQRARDEELHPQNYPAAHHGGSAVGVYIREKNVDALVPGEGRLPHRAGCLHPRYR